MKVVNRRLHTGWRAWFYRGRHRKQTRAGHLATSIVLFTAVYLR